MQGKYLMWVFNEYSILHFCGFTAEFSPCCGGGQSLQWVCIVNMRGAEDKALWGPDVKSGGGLTSKVQIVCCLPVRTSNIHLQSLVLKLRVLEHQRFPLEVRIQSTSDKRYCVFPLKCGDVDAHGAANNNHYFTRFRKRLLFGLKSRCYLCDFGYHRRSVARQTLSLIILCPDFLLCCCSCYFGCLMRNVNTGCYKLLSHFRKIVCIRSVVTHYY